EAKTQWTATRLQLLREGEHLSVSVKSLGGNPKPSHRCWRQTGDGPVVSLHNRVKQVKEANQLETSFGMKVEKWMNGGHVVCRVKQDGLQDRVFRKNISVIFPSNWISWSGQLVNGSDLNLTVETGEGNPKPVLKCTLNSGRSDNERLTV
uniref:Ig-like domain-containing protein n=1 Tax=Macrostomum lignano TaxID=282301 RepID=A0A1I8J6T2_9PLAT